MRLTGKVELDIFCKKYKECSYKESFQEWHDIVKKANWDKPSDVLDTFNKTDPNCRTNSNSIVCIFDRICGSRLICSIDYVIKSVRIHEVLSHDEYMEEKWKDKY